jgi:hypothetical protein
MKKMSIHDLLVKYREAVEQTTHSNPKVANKWARQMHSYYKQLRETEEGRAGTIALMSDENVHVRCWAASHSLQWEPETARAVLEAIRDSDGTCSLDAKWILREFDEGKLSFDH